MLLFFAFLNGSTKDHLQPSCLDPFTCVTLAVPVVNNHPNLFRTVPVPRNGSIGEDTDDSSHHQVNNDGLETDHHHPLQAAAPPPALPEISFSFSCHKVESITIQCLHQVLVPSLLHRGTMVTITKSLYDVLMGFLGDRWTVALRIHEPRGENRLARRNVDLQVFALYPDPIIVLYLQHKQDSRIRLAFLVDPSYDQKFVLPTHHSCPKVCVVSVLEQHMDGSSSSVQMLAAPVAAFQTQTMLFGTLMADHFSQRGRLPQCWTNGCVVQH